MGHACFRVRINQIKSNCRYGRRAISVDLFTNQSVQFLSNKSSKMDNLVFLCIAAKGHGFNNQLKSSRIRSSGTNNNQSIIALIYRPAAERCSFYKGGNSNSVVAKQSRDNFFARCEVQPGVKVMKLDHHGSSKEFNQRLEI
jgi:hypothetical protein